MDKTFEDSFNKFFVKLVVLNYKLKEEIAYTKEDEQILRLLNVLIPIYNRLETNDNISLEDVDTTTTTSVSTVKVELDLIEQKNQSDSEDEDDPIGDQQIKKLTEESLKILHDIRTNAWVNIESESDESDNLVYPIEFQTVII